MKEHNAKDLFKMGVNQLSDLSFEELFEQNHVTENIIKNINRSKMKDVGMEFISNVSEVETPDAFDWRDKNVVSRVGDQGMCGICYAFAGLHAVESQLAINNITVDLSVQEVLDCAGKHGTNNCEGGSVQGVFSYINAMNGISSESEYPFTRKVGNCKKNVSRTKFSVERYYMIFNQKEKDLKAILFLYGPLFVIFDVLHDSFFRYSNGIYYEPGCLNSSSELSHFVLLVGFGSEKGEDYWVIKNSYGTTWGENGFMRIARNKNNHCRFGLHCGVPVLEL